MEPYLPAYASYQQDDWAPLLPLAEFADNNHVSETNGVSPFFANYGFQAWFTTLPGGLPTTTVENAAQGPTQELQEHHDKLKGEIRWAQFIQKDAANAHRVPAPNYQVGNKVWLTSKNFKTKRPSNKLDWKSIGPYEVQKVISPYGYELRRANTMQLHPVFDVSLLSPLITHPVPGQATPPPPPVEIDNETEWEVESLLETRRRGRQLQCLVKYTGDYTPTWQPASDVANSPELVAQFHPRYPP